LTTHFGFSDTVSWIHGKHGFKFGGSLVPYQNNTVYDFFINGRFDFNGSAAASGAGNSFADFLFGLPDTYTQSRRRLPTFAPKRVTVLRRTSGTFDGISRLTLGIR